MSDSANHRAGIPDCAKATIEAWHSHSTEPVIRIPAIGLELHVRLPRSASGGALELFDTVNAPGFGPPLHRHSETEIFRVMSGRYLVELDGHRFYAEPGDVFTVPGGAAHAFVNVTAPHTSQAVIITPGFDAAAFFTQLGDLLKDGMPSKAVLNAFGGGWGVEFLGPPLRPS